MTDSPMREAHPEQCAPPVNAFVASSRCSKVDLDYEKQ
jgi:hypothetical protein